MTKKMTKKGKLELVWQSKEGYDCWIEKNKFGHRCGFVNVDKKNPTSELADYNDIPLNVHGRIHYGALGVWGFDCGKLNDSSNYWTLDKVKKETEKLADKLSKLTWEKILNYKLAKMPYWFRKRVNIKRGIK